MPNLTVMHQDQLQPPYRGGQPVSGGPAVEDHGRVVTATMQAAAFYRRAILANPRSFESHLSLGLLLARQIAEAHGGAVSLQGRADHVGAQAVVRLPLRS